MDLAPEIPTPRKLLLEAKAEPSRHLLNLTGYTRVIHTLYEKGFSYGKTAKWLSDRLKGPVNRGQVYYVYQNWLKEQRAKQSLAASSQMVEDAEGAGIDDQEAMEPEMVEFLQETEQKRLEKEADDADAKRKRRKRKVP